MNLLLLRHAESEHNILGSLGVAENDAPLTALGKDQAIKAAQICADYKPKVIYCSPYTRAVETATAISAQCEAPILQTESLREIDTGKWGGLSNEVLQSKLKEIGMWEWSERKYQWCPPGGESFEDVTNRSKRFIESLLNESDDTIICVTHNAVLKVLLAWLLNKPLSETMSMVYPNAAISGFEYTNNHFQELFIHTL
jgi:broad specificity phosphatase PhoE